MRGFLMRTHFKLIINSVFTPIANVAKRIDSTFFKISMSSKKDAHLKRPSDVLLRIVLKEAMAAGKTYLINISLGEAEGRLFEHVSKADHESEKVAFEKEARYHEALINAIYLKDS